MYESLSRNNISLNTGDGPDQYYDEVCALSAHTINDNFELLFKQRPEVKKLVFNDGRHGVMTATLLPPKIMIDPNQERAKNPEIYLKVAFEEGSIWYSTQSSVSISGWVITVSANLGHMSASAAHDDNDHTRFKKKRVLGELTKTFALGKEHFVLNDPTKVEAGKYSIHRLFAALTENAWNDPIDKYSTVPGPDGKPILLSEWAATADSLSKVIRVKETLKYWALQHEHSPFFTLGLQLRVHEAEGSDPTPTFAPFTARLQGYPYISQRSFDDSKARGEQPTGEIDDPHNCLVICETVSRRQLPNTHLLSFTGNLANPATPRGLGHLAGTFVLDHRLLLQGHLLRRLQELCMGSMVIPIRPKLYVASNGAGRCEAVYVVGAAPTDPEVVKTLAVVPPASADDAFYTLKPAGERCYQWSKRFDAPGSKTETYAYRTSSRFPLYRHWVTYSDQSVKVTWKEGADRFVVAGSTLFHHWEAYSSRETFPWKDMNTNEGYWGLYEITAKWSIEVDLTVAMAPDESTGGLKPVNGVVDPKIVGVDESTGLPTDFEVKTHTQKYDIAENYKVAENRIKTSLSASMKHLIENIKGKFDSAGRFTYPGASTIVFGRPQLANNGDVYADIDFQPPKEGLVNVRGPANFPFGDPLYRVPESVTIPSNPSVDTKTHPHLAWQATVKSYVPSTGRLKIVLDAVNPGTVATAFQMVKAQILQVRHENTQTRLFTEHDSEWEEKKKLLVEGEKKPDENKNPAEHKTEPDEEEKTPGEKDKKTGEPGETDGRGEGSGEVTVTVNLKKGDKQGSNDPETESPAPGAEPTEPGDKKPGDKKHEEPPSEEFHATWSLTAKDMEQALQLSVSREGSLDFTILPDGELASGLRARFIMKPESTFSLELEGTAPEPGMYVVQVHELWETTDLKDELDSSQWADSFASVKLIRSGDGAGSGISQSVSFDEAEKIQGVTKEGKEGEK